MKRVKVSCNGNQGEVVWNKKRPAKFKVKGDREVQTKVRKLLTNPKDFFEKGFVYKEYPTCNNRLFEIVLNESAKEGIVVEANRS